VKEVTMPGEEVPQAWIGKKVTVFFSAPGANPLPAILEGFNAYGVALRHAFHRTTEAGLAETLIFYPWTGIQRIVEPTEE
jgi:hypothetical protein